MWGSASQTGYEGVFGEHTVTSGYGVVGFGKGDGAGVLGRNSGGPGVQGEYTGTDAGYGVVGKGHYGVKGEGFYGIHGQGNLDGGFGVTGNGGVAGVLGRSSRGIGVEGEGKYGGQFEGSKAQLRLVPKRADTTGPPTGAHTKGEIYMDGAGTLFVCVASSTSTAAATWRKVSTTAVS